MDGWMDGWMDGDCKWTVRETDDRTDGPMVQCRDGLNKGAVGH